MDKFTLGVVIFLGSVGLISFTIFLINIYSAKMTSEVVAICVVTGVVTLLCILAIGWILSRGKHI